MNRWEIHGLRRHPDEKDAAARWFHEKWGVPAEAYAESMHICISQKTAVPQWYIAVRDQKIIGGIGVIENDFHDRKDLNPNICALYVEEPYRRQGLARQLLDVVCSDLKDFGIRTAYLVTVHDSLYEQYGWSFCGFARDVIDGQTMRIYQKHLCAV